ncbi:DUF1266 domain-containing protein [Spartinivicinus poritis]|uniref:DUF1266 domain-containing protein n=1 Tax=Spartinivicinus poritis TaxID=2994640 RepID=A0ABT5UA43_9GAMM|nr:DUF1266 domain-containing protein [Spartinivicinus sp. A2-2]MDE1463239.1 DUF1266 domain-containing protein [Spartinivicinus sp. A2-2]
MKKPGNKLNTYNPDQLTAAELWAIGLSSMLSCQNHERLDTLFGCAQTEENIEAWKQSHQRYWGVTDHDSLLDMGKWLVDEGGHNAGFMSRLNYLRLLTDKEQLIYIEQYKEDVDEYARLQLVYNNIGKLNAAGIMSWDMGRYINMLKKGIVIGYSWKIIK